MFILYSDEMTYQIKRDTFPDGTLHLNLPDFILRKIEWNYEGDEELFDLICIRKHYQWQNAPVSLWLPYIPHARMDRVKDPWDVFTLKYFCEIINSLNFSKVSVLDAHSNVSLALLDRVDSLEVGDYIDRAIEKSGAEALFFPDEGSMKRYSSMFSLPYAFGMKKRDWQTGFIMGLNVLNKENIIGKKVLIVDDICSRGGTFLHSANALKEAGAASISLYITHAEHTMIDGDMYNDPELVDKIYTTNSIFKKEWDFLNKVEII